MKKTIIFAITIMTLLGALAGCGNGNAEPSATASPAISTTTASATPKLTQDMHYSFTFEDVDGNTHSLADYKGKPVYLKIWGTWCSVCMTYLPDLERFAGEDHDFVVLSVVFPSISGEKSKANFIKWYKDEGLSNLTVLLDEKGQVLDDFGITGFPSQIMFDADGNVVTGFVGEIPDSQVEDVMQQIADGNLKAGS